MKKILKINLVFITCLFLLLFAGCSSTVDEISISDEVINEALADGKVELDELVLTVKSGSKVREVKVEEEMIVEGNIEELSVPGLHEITFAYKEARVTVTFNVPEGEVVDFEIDLDSITEAYQKDDFYHEDLLLNISYGDNVSRKVPLKDEYLSSADLIKLYIKGTHQLVFTYAKKTKVLSITVPSDKYESISDLAKFEDGQTVVFKSYISYAIGRKLYFYEADTVSNATVSSMSVVNDVYPTLTKGREIVACGKKGTVDNNSVITSLTGIVVNDNFDNKVSKELTSANELKENINQLVDFKNAKVVTVPTKLDEDIDVVFEVVDSNNNKVTVLIPKDEHNSFTQKVFVTLSELVVSHEIILEDMFVDVDSSGNQVLVINKASNIDYVKVEHEYQKPLEGVKNEQFEEFTTELFLYFLGDSPFNINYQIYDVEAFDTKYGTSLADAPVIATTEYDMSPASEIDYYNELLAKKEELTKFDRETLSSSQKLTYDVVLDYIERNLKFFDFDEDGNNIYFYYGTQLGSYLGYQAQLPSIIAEYRFDDEKDIENYFEYLKTTQDDFEALFFFEMSKITNHQGNQLTDYVIDLVIEQCDAFINTDEENYLITVFNDRISSYDFLTSERVEELKELNKKYVNESFVEAYKWLKENLLILKEANNDSLTGALADSEVGKRYYEILFQSRCGSDLTIPELIEYIEAKLEEYDYYSSFYPQYTGNLMLDAGLIVYDENNKIDYYASLDKVIPFFQDSVNEDFPELIVDFEYGKDIVIKEVAKALQDNSSPAFYLISPMDANIEEVIYINPPDFDEVSSYMFQTIAHEAWPGHLYQNVYYKNSDAPDVRKVVGYTSYAEGWANYVENYVVKYVSDNYGMQQMLLLDPIASLSACRMDIGINYEGWTVNDVIASYGLTKDDVMSGRYHWSNGDTVCMEDFEEMFYFYVEVPTNYLMYFFSCAQLLDIKAEFKEAMGVYYSEKLFHTIFLETGEASWPIIRNVYQEYADLWGTEGTARK